MTAIGYAGGDPTKVNKAGDTMTGLLLLSGDPVSGLGASTKNYTDSHGGGGGTVSSVFSRSGAVTAQSGDYTVAQVTGAATDAAVVHNTGAENINGVKTFAAAPVVPTNSFPESAIINLTTDLGAKAADTAVVHNTGVENVGGVKTFTSVPVLPAGSYGTTGNSAVGDVAAAGTAVTLSHSDHKHGREAFATPGNSAVGDVAAAGSAVTISHSDHVHGREGFGAVTSQTTYGAVSTNGVATTDAHSDHAHGTPALPTPVAIGAVATTDYTAYVSFGSLVNVTLGGTLPAQYRNEPGAVTRLHGTLTVGAGGILANVVFANIGAGSRPSSIPFIIGLRVTGSGVNNFLTVALNGDVSYKAALTAGDVLQFDGITYEHA